MAYNKSLKESDDLKLQLVRMVRNDGLTIAEAARALGLNERTCQSFFKQDMAWSVAWWKEYEGGGVAPLGVKIGFSEMPTFTKPAIGDEGRPIPNLPKIIKESTQEYKDMYFRIKQSFHPQKILVIADTQCKPTEDLSYMSYIGQYIFEKKPDIVVHIGDNYDFPSLSSYDKGKKSFEGRRLKADIEAGNQGMKLLTDAFLKDNYCPRMVFCMGNHEDRFDRLKNDMPELDGFVGTELLPLTEMGWEVHPFLKPVEICGIFFVHYLANPFTGKPYAGTALNQLKTVGRSFVVGHKQCLDVGIRPTLDGKHQIGIINGAAYPFNESYKGEQGNNHFRGITVLHEVTDGFGLPMFVSLDYLRGRYGHKD